ncbi:MAG: hypothetical protein KKF50_02070 [Nanoarchaeota archaeon]|nr:hypothetical protein [Nanoarchaeota archaeon]
MKFKFLYWTPRILSIIFILFISMFSLDIFEMNLGFWGTIVGLFMHLIPSFVLIIILIFAWRYEWLGGVVFILAGVFYMTMLLLNSSFEWYMLSWIAIISGPAILIGILWFLSWTKRTNKGKRKKR